MSRIVIAGASGFIGQYLLERYRRAGDEVSTIGRSGADAVWGDRAAIGALLEGADVLVNLAGKSVNCRYTEQNRTEIFRSRLETTRELREAVAACAAPPSVWFNSSTATIYRHAEDRPMTESTGELGTGFSVQVAKAWEAEFFDGDLPATRRVALRMAIVLGDGSVMGPLSALVRFGLGGPQLDGPWFSTRSRVASGTQHRFGARGGRQRFSWVHIDDVAGAIDFLRERSDLDGVVNVSAPHPTDDRTFMATLRRLLGVPVGLPAPRAVLEIGSAVIRTETELVLKSRWVLPERLTDAGYRFAFPELEPALRDVLATRSAIRS
ncbi:TIGR01777 family protein [Glaciibacter flavus]|uniref:TIGR01777 family protein n=1 Tax=Orlajensenia flava TaxID=2565934 RepID=A0A4S4FWU4_9MICO|nr:TIGR01777 family oxidoreductase [Glaciibacter flavus]THG35273.1 TIGR01777 family protein [Glaciibacter flavus]